MKKQIIIGLVVIAIVCLFIAGIIFPCTTFVINKDNQIVFGRNFDWMAGNGMIMINQRNVAKAAFIFPPEKPARWVSKYGSVTFNQVGREMPYGGMNETGLVVENMYLRTSIYPPVDERPAVSEVQWIQYMLDT